MLVLTYESSSRTPKWFVDQDGRAFGFRSDVPFWMESREEPEQLTFLERFEADCLSYIARCGPRAAGDLEVNNRGRHWYMVVGIDRQNKLVSALLDCSVKIIVTFYRFPN